MDDAGCHWQRQPAGQDTEGQKLMKPEGERNTFRIQAKGEYRNMRIAPL